jgi:hypothetical protein
MHPQRLVRQIHWHRRIGFFSELLEVLTLLVFGITHLGQADR